MSFISFYDSLSGASWNRFPNKNVRRVRYAANSADICLGEVINLKVFFLVASNGIHIICSAQLSTPERVMAYLPPPVNTNAAAPRR